MSEARTSMARALVCRLGDQWLGLDVHDVREVVAPQPLARVPLAPEGVCGLINLRGRILTQVDVRPRLGVPVEDTKRLRIVVVETGEGEEVGIVVDEVDEVREVDPEHCEPPPSTLPEVWRELGSAVFKEEGRVVVLVDDADKLVRLTLPDAEHARR